MRLLSLDGYLLDYCILADAVFYIELVKTVDLESDAILNDWLDLSNCKIVVAVVVLS